MPVGFFLLLTGLMTALPLLCFNLGAARLRYATIGLIQYVAPTGQFLLAVFTFGEPLTRVHLAASGFISRSPSTAQSRSARSPRRHRPGPRRRSTAPAHLGEA